MRRIVFWSAAFGWVVGIIIVALYFGGSFAIHVLDASSSSASADDRVSSVDSFTPAAALSRAEQLGAEQLAKSLGRREASADGGTIGPLQVDGHTISVADLTLKSITLSRGSRTVTDGGNSFAVSGRGGVWVASWERVGIPVPEWNNAPARVTVQVVFEDGTGTLNYANVGKVPLDSPQ